jgi:Peptidase family M23
VRRSAVLRLITAVGLVLLAGSGLARADFWSDAGHAIEKAAHDTGHAVEKATQDTGHAVEKAAQDTGHALEKAAQDTGAEGERTFDNLNHFADETAKVFCDIFTLGGYSRHEAGCGINAGVGASTNGQEVKPYIYDPNTPEQHYEVTEAQKTLPTQEELNAASDLFKPTPMEQWERDEDAAIPFFLKPGDQVGLPWAGMLHEVSYPNGDGAIRHPGGDFMDTRTDANYPDKWRFHGGIDFLNQAGGPVYAPSAGTIVRTFQPTKPGTLAIEVRNAGGYTTQVLYLQPTQAIQDALTRKEPITVHAGERIGVAQDAHRFYPPNVPQHVHVTVKDSQRRFVSPDGKTVLFMQRGKPPAKMASP